MNENYEYRVTCYYTQENGNEGEALSATVDSLDEARGIIGEWNRAAYRPEAHRHVIERRQLLVEWEALPPAEHPQQQSDDTEHQERNDQPVDHADTVPTRNALDTWDRALAEALGKMQGQIQAALDVMQIEVARLVGSRPTVDNQPTEQPHVFVDGEPLAPVTTGRFFSPGASYERNELVEWIDIPSLNLPYWQCKTQSTDTADVACLTHARCVEAQRCLATAYSTTFKPAIHQSHNLGMHAITGEVSCLACGQTDRLALVAVCPGFDPPEYEAPRITRRDVVFSDAWFPSHGG